MVDPQTVNSPKARWVLIDVLYDGGEEDSLALGRWYDEDGGWHPVLGMRWNGIRGKDKGHPQTRGLPTWYIVPEHYYRAILTSEKIPPNKKALAEEVLRLSEKGRR